VSADDFRDLVTEWDHSAHVSLEFQRWTPPSFAHGERIPGTGGYVIFEPGGPYACVPYTPTRTIEQMSEGDRERDAILVWQWSELLDGTPVQTLRTIDQSSHGKPDRVRNVTTGRVYQVERQGDYAAVAKVNSVICRLIDGAPPAAAEPEPP
jgi:hypothetical protein